MDIHISRDSDVPVHEQITAQFVLLIGTGGLEAGASWPSVRALAQRLGVHRNTVSRACHSPAKCIGCLSKGITGDPDPKHVSTSYVER